jgi:hypothetical protein
VYRETLDQQEGEYESELKELIAAAEHEIQNERENTAKAGLSPCHQPACGC